MLASRNHKRSGHAVVENSEVFSFYRDLVDHLYSKPIAGWFRQPVDSLWTNEALGNYYDIIKEPMDLGTVKNNLTDGEYIVRDANELKLNEAEIQRHIFLVFENAKHFNEEDSNLYRNAAELEAMAKSMIEEDEQRAEHIPHTSKKRHKKEKPKSKPKSKSKAKSKPRSNQEGVAEPIADKAMANANFRVVRTRAEKGKEEVENIQKVEQFERIRKASQKVVNEKKHKEEMHDFHERSQERSEILRKRSYRLDDGAAESQAARPSKKAKTKPSDMPVAANPIPTLNETNDAKNVKHEPKHPARQQEQRQDTLSAMMFNYVYVNDMVERNDPICATGKKLLKRHQELIRKRHNLVQAYRKDRRDRVAMQMTDAEKDDLCANVTTMDFQQMEQVADILRVALDMPSLAHDNEVDVPLQDLENSVLREIETIVSFPRFVDYHARVEKFDLQIEEIENKYVELRYEERTLVEDVEMGNGS